MPIIIAAVLIDESGENKQDTIIPIPAPVKNSTIDFSFFIFPVLFLYQLSSPSLNPPLSMYPERFQTDCLYLSVFVNQDNFFHFLSLKLFVELHEIIYQTPLVLIDFLYECSIFDFLYS